MNCPHCSKSIDPALITAARQSDLGKRSRPGAKGLVRRGCAHIAIRGLFAPQKCLQCERIVRWSAARNTFLLVRKKGDA